MANKKVTLVRRCKTETGWKRYYAVIGKTGKVKPFVVLVKGEERSFPEGEYQIRFYRGDKTVYESVGNNPTDALQARDKKIRSMTAHSAAGAAGIELPPDDQARPRIADRVTEYLEKVELSKRNTGLGNYRMALGHLLDTTNKTFVDEIGRMDLLRFADSLRKMGYAENTVYNRFVLLMTFLKDCKISTQDLISTGERPVREEEVPESYDIDEVRALLARVTSSSSRMLFEFLLKTGLREGEAVFLEWTDLDFRNCVLTIRNKPSLGFTIKSYQGRDITLEQGLARRLESFKKTHGHSRYVFATKSGQRNNKMLRQLKRAVKNAGLACGVCEPCMTRGECEHWFLHKFRATFATTSLHNGMDLHTLMKLMGHKDLKTTMRYLSTARTEVTRQKMNAIFADIGG